METLTDKKIGLSFTYNSTRHCDYCNILAININAIRRSTKYFSCEASYQSWRKRWRHEGGCRSM